MPKILFLLVVAAFGVMSIHAQTGVRPVFKLVPSEYFNIACCDGNVDEFAKKYVTIEDDTNGYMKGDDMEEDAKYAGFVLKVFKAGNRTIVGLYSHGTSWEDYYFLELRRGKLVNISKTIPRYSQDNIYDFGRKSNVINVYRKKYENTDKSISVDGGVSRGKFLYKLFWRNGKFIPSK